MFPVTDLKSPVILFHDFGEEHLFSSSHQVRGLRTAIQPDIVAHEVSVQTGSSPLLVAVQQIGGGFSLLLLTLTGEVFLESFLYHSRVNVVLSVSRLLEHEKLWER